MDTSKIFETIPYLLFLEMRQMACDLSPWKKDDPPLASGRFHHFLRPVDCIWFYHHRGRCKQTHDHSCVMDRWKAFNHYSSELQCDPVHSGYDQMHPPIVLGVVSQEGFSHEYRKSRRYFGFRHLTRFFLLLLLVNLAKELLHWSFLTTLSN